MKKRSENNLLGMLEKNSVQSGKLSYKISKIHPKSENLREHWIERESTNQHLNVKF